MGHCPSGSHPGRGDAHDNRHRAIGIHNHHTCPPVLAHEAGSVAGHYPRYPETVPVYENVCAERTLLDVGGKPIAGAIGFDFAPDFELSKRHYYGPGDTWWGSDMAITPYGRGRCILSQLRLLDNLGKDPVADKILFNLIEWITESE